MKKLLAFSLYILLLPSYLFCISWDDQKKAWLQEAENPATTAQQVQKIIRQAQLNSNFFPSKDQGFITQLQNIEKEKSVSTKESVTSDPNYQTIVNLTLQQIDSANASLVTTWLGLITQLQQDVTAGKFSESSLPQVILGKQTDLNNRLQQLQQQPVGTVPDEIKDEFEKAQVQLHAVMKSAQELDPQVAQTLKSSFEKTMNDGIAAAA